MFVESTAVVLKTFKNTHPFHGQRGDAQQSSSSDAQNQPSVRQQEVNHHGNTIFPSPPTALEVHRFCLVGQRKWTEKKT